ncbi:helix-turn-helix domain-containing protein [Longispora sp. NPDC051575]|uniref:helix-turn-helix domain-containing protein n=1 Tax=Longispora sp. NPDC051575 TaxID=3154943 RepID=UPI003413FF79
MTAVNDFGSEMRYLRQRKGLTIREVGRQVFISYSMISKYENGQLLPKSDIVQRLDDLLDGGGALVGRAREVALSAPGHPSPATGLPTTTRHFVGRNREIGELLKILTPSGALMSEPAGVLVLHGAPGIGKTALAAWVARLLLPRFEHGCQFVDLHGYTEGRAPADPGEVLDRLLRRLGERPEALPADVEELAALFRARTADRELLLILDNVRSTAQIQALLPDGAQCRTLVTSRNFLSALDGVPRLSLRPLEPDDADTLFRLVSSTSDTDGYETADIARIAEYCGRLPLAVRIAAVRCGPDSQLAVSRFAGRLADEYARFRELDDGERSVKAAFEESRKALDATERELFALLGLLPPEIMEVAAVAALSALDLPVAERGLDRLVDAGLLIRVDTEHYVFHDLIGAFARLAARDLAGPHSTAALRGLLDHTVRSCSRADSLVTPGRRRFPPPPTSGPEGQDFEGYDHARDWLAQELPALVALCRTAYEHGFDEYCWMMAFHLRGVFFLGKHWTEWEESHAWALAAARRSGNAVAQAATLNNLGLALVCQGQLDLASDRLTEAADIAGAAGDEDAQCTARSHHAWVMHLRGEHERALAEEAATLAYYQARGRERNAAIVLRDMAAIEIVIGRFDDALGHLTSALDVFRAIPSPLDTAMALNCLAEIHLQRADLVGAWHGFADAFDVASLGTIAFERARAQHGLGRTAAAHHDNTEARRLLKLALSGYTSLSAREEVDHVRADLAALAA